MSIRISYQPSPIAEIRHRYKLTRREAAGRMKIPERFIAVMEMRTHKVPQHILEAIDRMLSPVGYHQISIWDAIEEASENEAVDRG